MTSIGRCLALLAGIAASACDRPTAPAPAIGQPAIEPPAIGPPAIPRAPAPAPPSAPLARATDAEHLASELLALARSEEASGLPWLALADYDRVLRYGSAPETLAHAQALRAQLRVPTPMAGPYPSIEAMCPDLARGEDRLRSDGRASSDPDPPYPCTDCVFVCRAS
jgi:hypothetical protein